MKKITILIAEDHSLVRETWSYLLNNDSRFKVVGESGSGKVAVKMAAELRPNVVIMDVSLPDMNGIEATKRIRESSPSSKVLGVSMHNQPSVVRKIIKNGAKGYVTKNSTREELCNAIIEIHNNRTYICSEVRKIMEEEALDGKLSQHAWNSLSKRELDVVRLLIKGFSSKEMAVELGITFKTIEVHRYNILKKLKLKNTVSLVNFVNSIDSEFD